MRLEKLFSGMLAASFVIGAAQAQGENQPPVCTDQGDIVVECQGLTTSVTITVNVVDPEGDPLSYGWDYCPAAFLTDPTSPTTEVIFDTSMTCSLSCGMRYDIVDHFGNKCASGFYVFVVPGTDGCSPGYWKNHPEAWPVGQITVGGVTYSRAQALAWLDSVGKDRTTTMFSSLVSAMLNAMVGNDTSCVATTITAADQWMATYGPVGKGVHAASYAWKIGEPLHRLMDNYNNGMLCAPHRD